jgi:hypothetical protein
MLLSLRQLALSGPLALLVLSGCLLDSSTTRMNSGTVVAEHVGLDQAVGIGVVRFLNDPATTVFHLQDVVGLDETVATGLVSHRQGHDAVDDTDDDALFRDFADVLRVESLDEVAVQRLADAAYDEDLVPVRAIETVWFSARELSDTLSMVNEFGAEELDEFVASRAVRSIVRGRPFVTLMDLAEEPYLGPAALLDLREAATALVKEEAT